MLIKALLMCLVVAGASSVDHEVKPYPGKPVAIFSYASGDLQLNTKALDVVFAHKDLVGRKIALYGIDGAKLEGKSLFMDYMLRYMYHNYKSVASPETPLNYEYEDWLGDEEEPLQGFTTMKEERELGISMWSDIFLFDAPNGDKYAIVIVDSRIVSDPKWTYAENSLFFFLNCMVNSVQIFNMKERLEEKHFDYLEFVARFGKLNEERKDETKPFGSLIFLTRSSVDPDYGFEGGQKSLFNFLNIKHDQTDGHNGLRKNIGQTFTTFSNYQMPGAGSKIHEKEFDGRRSQLNHNFVDHMKYFAENVLSEDHLVVKNIHGEKLDVSRYYLYMKKYAEIMKTDDLKSIDFLYDARV